MGCRAVPRRAPASRTGYLSGMGTIRVNPSVPDPRVMEDAARVIRRGGLVAFPTETVYGLGANALDERAVAGIFEAKGRPSFNPLIVHVPDADSARGWVASWPAEADRLASAFWPGPLTMVLTRGAEIPGIVSGGLPTVALRIPAHPVALALLRASAVPIAAPSANRYTGISPTSAEHVERALGDRVDMILDAGPTRVGIESTVVDLTGPVPALLRPGMIPPASLREVLGALELPADRTVAEGTVRASPGMGARHYAPRARVHLFDAGEREAAAAMADRAAASGERVGALLLAPLAARVELVVRMPADPDEYAHALYAALHQVDASGCTLLLVERVPEGERWGGVRDRLERASREEG